MSITEKGNPRKPTGIYGEKMLDGMNERHSSVTEWGLSFLHVSDHAALLDIGCGGGATLKRLSALSKEGTIFGLDYSEVSVQKSTEYNQDLVEAGRIKVLQGSVESMPFKEETFHGITTVESFYFWPNPAENLKEVRRVLKTGCSFLLIADIHGGYDLDAEALENIQKYNLFNPTPEEFEELFKNAGFSKTSIHLKENTSWICVDGQK